MQVILDYTCFICVATIILAGASILLATSTTAATCGAQKLCPDGTSCCSQYGFCGNTVGFCGDGCVSMCKNSTGPSPSSSSAPLDMVSSAISEESFNQFFYSHNQSACPASGFYNRSSFLAAAATFPAFGTTGGSDSSKRELAAFFACAAVNIDGGCYVNSTNQSQVDCSVTSEWGCASGKKYYGRGPLQLSWNVNYGPAGQELGFDGINDPDVIATDPVLSFRAALWYWMTVHLGQNYSCHLAMLTEGEGFKEAVSVVAGAAPEVSYLQSTSERYNQFCTILGVAPSPSSTGVPWGSNATSAGTSKPESCIGHLCSTLSKVLGLALPLAFGGLVLMVLAFAVFKQLLPYQPRDAEMNEGLRLQKIQGLTESPLNFPYATLERATKGFTAVIGKGGFGVVFKGELPSGEAIAVKVLTESAHTEQQFLGEIETVGKLHHVNVVRLMGFCMDGSKRMLVYEFVSNSSLDNHLFGKLSEVLSWDRRYQIALGVARGLSYIHEECRHKIIHRDMKPQNILLDELFCAKISDFGLAKIMKREESRVVSQLKGTPGYMAPEFWAERKGPLSTKFDVYSYGMVVLELVAGRQNVQEQLPSEQTYLSEWAFTNVFSPALIIDPRIRDHADLLQAQVLVLVGLWCILEDPSLRPSMSRVVQYLEGSVDVPKYLPQPLSANVPKHPSRLSTSCDVATHEISFLHGR